jgi:PD-(D/E)XK endonuclease
MHTTDKGEVARYSAAAHLMKLGFVVSVPLTENSSYDLLLDKDGKFYRTQIKKATLINGVLKIKLYTANHNKNIVGSIKKYTSKDIDWLIGVDIDSNRFYLIDYSTGVYNNKNSVWLRLDESKRKRKDIRIAKDYELCCIIEQAHII